MSSVSSNGVIPTFVRDLANRSSELPIGDVIFLLLLILVHLLIPFDPNSGKEHCEMRS
jgi:hypothetical protein